MPRACLNLDPVLATSAYFEYMPPSDVHTNGGHSHAPKKINYYLLLLCCALSLTRETRSRCKPDRLPSMWLWSEVSSETVHVVGSIGLRSEFSNGKEGD